MPKVGKWIQLSYKVYAEVGERSLINSAKGFWDTINNAQQGGITWTWARQLIVMNVGGGCTNDYPRATHWTSDAKNWIGLADFLFYSGHGFPEGLVFTDDYGNNAYVLIWD